MKAVLTGHTRGFGAAVAENLLARGIPVLGIARHPNQELARRFPALREIVLDLSDPNAVAAWTEGPQLEEFLAGADKALLVNNAGVVQPIGPLGMQDARAIGRAVNLNTTTPLILSSALVRTAPGNAEKRIVHISSGAGRRAYPGWSIYCATKAALDHHALSVALDDTSRVRICSIAPGVLDTDMQAEIRAASPRDFPLHARFDGLKRDGNLADPAQTATRLVDYLLSDAFGKAAVADLREMS